MDEPLDCRSDSQDLYIEIARLQKAIDEVNQQKVQAAEYGLAVLQEKQQLQEQLDQLELVNEQTSTELQHLKQVFTGKSGYFSKACANSFLHYVKKMKC